MKIIKGSDTIMNVKLVEKSTKEPFNLEDFSSASAFFAGAAGDSVAATGSVVSADRGMLTFPLNDVFTETLQAGDELDIELHVEQGATKTIVQILGKLEVAEQLF